MSLESSTQSFNGTSKSSTSISHTVASNLPIPAPIMQLRDLPLDLIRPIMFYLDLESLVWLYATFDHRIQKLLRSPQAITVLTLKGLHKLPAGPVYYAIGSLRDVPRVELQNCLEWSLARLALLKSLNPFELSMGSFLFSPEALYEDSLSHSESITKPLGFPHLPRLTPRLHTLEILGNLELREGFKMIEFPTSLTSLSLPQVQILTTDIDVLPHGLRLLSMQGEALEFLLPIFNHLTSLESLCLRYYDYGYINDVPDVSHTRAPSTLTKLEIKSRSVFPSFALTGHLLEHCSQLRHLKVVGQRFPSRHPTEIILPSSIQSLDLRIEDNSPRRLTLPPSLTELRLGSSFVDQRLIDEALPQLSGSLTKLTLEDASNGVTFESLPSDIKSLNLELHRDLSDAEIDSLPPNLTELYLSNFYLENLDKLRRRAPECHLHFTKALQEPSPHSTEQFLIEKFAALIPPVMDVVALHAALDDYATSNRLHFELHSDLVLHYSENSTVLKFRPSESCTLVGKSVVWKNLGKFLDNDVTLLSTIRTLDLAGISSGSPLNLFHTSITCMDVGNCTFESYYLPPTLTHLTSTAKVGLSSTERTKVALNFRVLDTPKWTFSASYLLKCTFKDCINLKCHISKMEDYDVVPFLTHNVSLVARLNMSLSISALINNDPAASYAMQVCDAEDYKVLKRETISNLSRGLNASTPKGIPEILVSDGTGLDSAVGASLTVKFRDDEQNFSFLGMETSSEN